MKNSYKNMEIRELLATRETRRKRLMQLKTDKVLGHLANPLEIRVTRRSIARLNSRIYEKALEGEV